jgi:hypothetical protein
MTKIINVVAGNDYIIEIELDNHHKIYYDIKPRLQAVRFCELIELDRFKAVTIENGNTLVWDSLCQISIDEIFSIIQR